MMNFRPRHISEDELQEMRNRVRGGAVGTRQLPLKSIVSRADCEAPGKTPRRTAGSNPAPSPYKYNGYRSKLEYSWANYLNGLVALGSIANFYYEPFNIRLPGKKNFYNPDFMVIACDGMTFYEIKGRNKSDDRSLVKIKTAAGIHKWAQFVVVKWIKGRWEERSIA